MKWLKIHKGLPTSTTHGDSKFSKVTMLNISVKFNTIDNLFPLKFQGFFNNHVFLSWSSDQLQCFLILTGSLTGGLTNG